MQQSVQKIASLSPLKFESTELKQGIASARDL